MYIQKKYTWEGGIQVEKYSVGNQGAKGKKREPRKKPTPEDMARQNRTNKVKKLCGFIRKNFRPGDFHLVLTVAKELRMDTDLERKEVKKFLAKMKREYEKLGQVLKWILVIEVGKKGGIHHHLIINDINVDGIITTKLVSKHWNRGRPKFTPLDDDWDYRELAEYLIKQSEQNTAKNIQSYTRSRNLTPPKEKKDPIMALKWREQPVVPEGYYLEKNSFYEGINPITGKIYQTYTLLKLRGKEGKYSG